MRTYKKLTPAARARADAVGPGIEETHGDAQDGPRMTTAPTQAAGTRSLVDGTDDPSPRRVRPTTAGEASYVGPLQAFVRRPLLVLLPILLIMLPALAWVYTTPATYRAQSEILVGRIDVEANAVPGFVSAVQQLAGTYARLVNTTDVAALAAEQLAVPVDEVRDNVTGSPVPESSIIAIEASADDQASALALAEASSASLIAYVRQQSTPVSADDETLADYRKSALDLNLARARVANAETARDRAVDQGTAAQRTAAEVALAEAQADVAASQLRVDTLAGVFGNNQRGGTERNSLQAINEPLALGSDRRAKLQLAIGASLVLGMAVGFALVTLRANLPALRAARQRGRGAPLTAHG